MNKRTVLLIATLLAANAVFSQAKDDLIETKISRVTHSHFALPFGLVPDAGQRAAKFSADAREQWQYINNCDEPPFCAMCGCGNHLAPCADLPM